MKKIKIKKPKITKKGVFDFLETLVILVIFAFLGIWFAYGKRAGDSEKFVTQYFEYLLTGNYEKMYEMTDIVESKFIDYDSYSKMMESHLIKGGIDKYDIELLEKETDSRTYEIKYVKKDETEGTITVKLDRQAEKKYLIFNSWKVNIEDEIVDKYVLGVPVDMNVTLDGKDIEEYVDTESIDGSTRYYELLRIFTGSHNVKISGKNIDALNENIIISHEDTEKVFQLDDFGLNPQVACEIEEYSEYVLGQMFAHALEGVEYSGVEPLFAKSEKARATILKVYEKMVNWTTGEDGAQIETFEIKKMKDSIYSYNYPDEVVVKVVYSYQYSAKAPRTMLTANQDLLEGKGKEEAYLTFNKNKNGEWKIVRVKINLPDYLKQ